MREPPKYGNPALVNTQDNLGRCLILGGAGYFGRSLAQELVRRGHEVVVFDRVNHPDVPAEAEFVEGDVRDYDGIVRAMSGCETVFHSAALIVALTLSKKAERKRVYDVNVEGTRYVLRAARELGITRVVYTSSMNVLRMPIAGGDESAPYHDGPTADLYSRSKAEAEKLVLRANGSGLYTCAIRPGGIYGPGERQHLGRLVDELKAGKLILRLGSGTKADNIYIDDLVDAHLRAAERLGPEGEASGKAYNISDGQAQNYFEFFRPAIEGLGYTYPRFSLPGGILVGLAWGLEVLHFAGGPRPFTTVMEAHKLVRDNYLDIDRARRDLGWEPKVDYLEGMRRCMPHLKALHAEP